MALSDPAWVADKAYYPMRRMAAGGWRPEVLVKPRLLLSSLFPTARQLREFEQSPAFLGLIFEDAEVYTSWAAERRKRRAEKRSATATATAAAAAAASATATTSDDATGTPSDDAEDVSRDELTSGIPPGPPSG